MINADMRTYHYTEGGPAVGFTQTVLLSDQDERCSTTSIKSAKFRFHAPNGIQEKLSVNQVISDSLIVNGEIHVCWLGVHIAFLLLFPLLA